jgi:hypothetical protein
LAAANAASIVTIEAVALTVSMDEAAAETAVE